MEDLTRPIDNVPSSIRSADVQSANRLRKIGDYRILREIGRGGMGIVYEAEQESLQRRVALKILPEVRASSPKVLKRFQREAAAAARLHHTNIVPVFGVGEDNGIHYLVMQFIDGQGLDRFLSTSEEIGNSHDSEARAAAVTDDGSVDEGQDTSAPHLSMTLLYTSPESETGPPPATPHDHDSRLPTKSSEALESHAEAQPIRSVDSPALPDASASLKARPAEPTRFSRWRDSAYIGRQVANALHYAHEQGVLHRDIKPANLLRDRQGTIWVTDFGLAKVADGEDLTNSRDVIGTLRYMAPETLGGQSDTRSDIYSLGLTLYELLTSRPAFEESDYRRLIRQVSQPRPAPPRRLDPRIPRDLETIVLKAIAPEPDARYQTGADLSDDLTRYLENRPILARRSSSVERLWRWGRRNPVVAALGGLVSALLLVIAVVSSVGYLRASAESARANANLQLAAQAFDGIFDRLTATHAPRSLDIATDDRWGVSQPVVTITQEEAALLQSLLGFYHQFAELNEDNVNLEEQTARAHRRVGDIRARLGQNELAESAYRCALQIYLILAERFPGDPTVLIEAASAQNELGVVFYSLGQVSNAREAHIKAREILAQREGSAESRPEHRFELARTYNLLGALALSPGPQASRRSVAFDGLDSASQLLEGLLESDPNNSKYRLAAAQSYVNHQLFALRQGELDKAEEWYARAADTLQRLVADDPENPDYVFRLAETHALTQFAQHTTTASEEAMTRLRQAVDLAEDLVDSHPNVPEYTAFLARSLIELGEILESLGETDDAERTYVRAGSLQETLVSDFPTTPAYHSYLAQARYHLADLQRRAGSLPEARSTLEKAIENFETSLGANAREQRGRRLLARMHRSLGEGLAELGETVLAEKAFRKAQSLEESWRAGAGLGRQAGR